MTKQNNVLTPKPPAPAVEATTFDVRVRALRWEAPGVISLELNAIDGHELPPFEPGAHIDIHLPGNVLRQYSLCGDPADLSSYRVGIRAVAGGRSSDFIHRRLRPGEIVTVSAPRNNFPLVNADRYLFVAGGIGITPLLPMLRAVHEQRKPWTLLYCNKTGPDAPFLRDIETLGGTVQMHNSASGTRLDVPKVLSTPQKDTALYCCGPEKLMLAVEEATAAWPKDSVHFEWFAPRTLSNDVSAGSFEIACEKSGLTLQVPPDRSVLDVLINAGINVPCSCRQGVCGTCEVRVLSGEVDHRDSILSPVERSANESMMTCVSRANTARLVLDI